MSQKWHEKGEKAGLKWLKITLFLVRISPRWLMRFYAFWVAAFYWIFSPKERENLKKYYANLEAKFGPQTRRCTFLNFYEFAVSITDKIAVWHGKIGEKDLIFKDDIRPLFFSGGRGKIVLMSHFGNPDVTRALGAAHALKMAVFAHFANTQNFAQVMMEIGGKSAKYFMVESLGVAEMVEISRFLDEGGFLFMMGDRVLGGGRSVEVEFLGRRARFAQGGFLMAALLKCEIWSLWCERVGGRFEVGCERLGSELSRREVGAAVERYAAALERRCERRPQMWFNFYDFWENDNESL